VSFVVTTGILVNHFVGVVEQPEHIAGALIQPLAAGVVSKSSVIKTVVVDTSPPAAPTVVGLTAASDTGTVGDNITAQAQPTLSITAEAKATVQVFANGQLVGTALEVAATPGTYTFKTTYGPGTYDITARAMDLAGNAGAVSTGYEFDVVAPLKAPTLALAPFSDTGTSITDKITSDKQPTFSGTTDAGALVTILKDSVVQGTATAGPNGVWTFKAPDALSDGPHIFVAQVTDAAGVTQGSAPAGGTITVDAAAPTVTKVTATNATVAAGGRVSVVVEFTENVTTYLGEGRPTLELDLGGVTREAIFVSGTGNKMTFEYFVRGGDA
jgi:hypothetical protein